MKLKIICLIFLAIFPLINFCLDNEKYVRFKQAVNASHNRSYLAPINFGDLNHLLFEARISDHYFINFRKNTTWAADGDFNIVMRMLDQKSVPIFTPSYNPGVNLYYYSKDKSLSGSNIIYSLGFYHFSNGQNGKFYNEDGSINTKDGNFSTNYISFKSFSLFRDNKRNYIERIVGSQLKLFVFTYPKIRNIYPKGSLEISLEDFITNLYKIIDPFKWKNKDYYKNKDVYTLNRFKVNIGYIFGNMSSPSNFEDRISLEIISSFKPAWLDDFSFFAKYYYGKDYYNIHFTEKLSQFSIGIMADNFTFRNDK